VQLYAFRIEIAKSQQTSTKVTSVEIMPHYLAIILQNFIRKFSKLVDVLIFKRLILQTAISSIALLTQFFQSTVYVIIHKK